MSNRRWMAAVGGGVLLAVSVLAVMGSGWSSSVPLGSTYRANSYYTHAVATGNITLFAPNPTTGAWAATTTTDQGFRPRWIFINAYITTAGANPDTITIWHPGGIAAGAGDTLRYILPTVTGNWSMTYGGARNGIERVFIKHLVTTGLAASYNITWTD